MPVCWVCEGGQVTTAHWVGVLFVYALVSGVALWAVHNVLRFDVDLLRSRNHDVLARLSRLESWRGRLRDESDWLRAQKCPKCNGAAVNYDPFSLADQEPDTLLGLEGMSRHARFVALACAQGHTFAAEAK